MKYFKVKIGYGADDFITITENELPRAIKAQVNGGIVIFEEGSTAGNNIMAILPDYHRALGLNRGYTLTSEDYARIGGKVINEYRNALLMASSHARRISERDKTLIKGADPIVELISTKFKELPDGNKN